MAPMAFMGGLEQSIPYFVRRGRDQGTTVGYAPFLKDVIGLDSFRVGPLGRKEGHWLRLLGSKSRTGLELAAAHHSLVDKVKQAREYQLPDS